MKRTSSLAIATAFIIAAAGAAPDLPLPTDDPPPVAIPVPDPEADLYQHIGIYQVCSCIKVTDDVVTRVEIKPMILHVTSNGTTIRVSTEGAEAGTSTYEIYRSDGIGRQNGRSGVLEVIPGVQGSSCKDGVMRHIRVSRESLTITRFAGVSNQTVITHAVIVRTEDRNVASTPSTP
jgi:hypothetical protein